MIKHQQMQVQNNYNKQLDQFIDRICSWQQSSCDQEEYHEIKAFFKRDHSYLNFQNPVMGRKLYKLSRHVDDHSLSKRLRKVAESFYFPQDLFFHVVCHSALKAESFEEFYQTFWMISKESNHRLHSYLHTVRMNMTGVSLQDLGYEDRDQAMAFLKELPKSLKVLNLLKIEKLLPRDIGWIVKNFPYLEVLALEGDFDEETVQEICQLQQLKELTLIFPTLINLPKEIGNLQSLEKLDLTHCSQLASLPKEIGNLERLQQLRLIVCYALKKLPNEIGNLQNLQKLDLTSCNLLQTLPKEMEQLQKLEELVMAGCFGIQHLPDSIGGCRCLKMIDLMYCTNLKTITHRIDELKKLKTLILEGCGILAFLPFSLGQCRNLRTLNIQGCLVAIPPAIFTIPDIQIIE